MHELVGVRLHNVGPPRSPFDATLDLRLISEQGQSSDVSNRGARSASSATLILGDNGIGKSGLARLVRAVVDPTLRHSPRSPRTHWQGMAPSVGVGQVLLKWREVEQGRTFVTALAVQCAGDSNLRPGYYIIQAEAETDFDSLIPGQGPSTLAEIRGHLEKFASSQPGIDLIWETSIFDWRKRLEALGLGLSSVCLINGDPPQGWVNSRDDFVGHLMQLVVIPEELREFAEFDSRVPSNVTEHSALRSKLAVLVTKVLDGLTLFESLSEQAPSKLEGRQELLVNCTFNKPTFGEIEERIGRVLDRARGIFRGNGYSLLQAAVREATSNEIRISVCPPDSGGRFIDIDKIEFCSGGERVAVCSLLQLLLVRLAVVSQGAQHKACVVILDDCVFPMERSLRNHSKMIASWGLQAIYLSAHAYVAPSTFESLFSLYSITRPGDDRRNTIIARAGTLKILRGGGTGNDLIAGLATIPIAEVFEIRSEASDVKSGDFFLPTIRRVGDQRSVWIADNSGHPFERPESVITLRPRRPLRPGEALFYASYFGSEKFLGEEVGPGQLVLVRARELKHARLPSADQETLRAIAELTAAAVAFEEWRRDAHGAVDSFFQWRDIAAGRADIIEAGRLTRQRHEAAQVLANRGPRFRATLPYPIARRWRDVEATSSGDSGYRSVIDCAEASITYCAALGLAFAGVQSITVPRLQAVAGRLQTGRTRPSFGDWSAVLNNLAEIAISAPEPADSPLRYYRRYSGDDVKGAIKSLKDRRNDFYHGRGPDAHRMSAYTVDAKAELERVLSASEWLVDYPLRYLESERWDSFGDTSELTYRELMGDHNVVSLGHDETSGHLESRSLYTLDQFGRYYLLRPFLHGGYCDDCGQLTVFVIDGWSPAADEAEYKAIDHPHMATVQRASLGLRRAGLLLAAQT